MVKGTPRKPRVVWWHNIPTPSLIERFNLAACNDQFDFEVWFGGRSWKEYEWEFDESSWMFSHRYLSSFRAGPISLQLPTPLLGTRSSRPDLLISLYASPSYLAGWSVARLLRIRTAFWVEATNEAWIRRRGWKEAIKRFTFARTDGFLTTGESGRQYLRRYRVDQRAVYRTPNSIDVPRIAGAVQASGADREMTRKQLGLRGVTFVYSGRLWWGKGLDYLLDALKALQASAEADVSLLLIGIGDDMTRLQQRCLDEAIQNVVLVGFRQATDLPRLYAAVDVFVFPTLGDTYGLVLDEALASGLPVISTTVPGEINDRLREGVNGFQVPPRDAVALTDRMRRLAKEAGLRRRMGAGIDANHRVEQSP